MTQKRHGDQHHAGDIADVVDVDFEYEADSPKPKKKFLPWHKPRKHYVRERQWCRSVNILLRDHPVSDGRVRYLGLPGDDLLDIRSFHSEVCVENDIKIKFLGFNTSAGSSDDVQLNVSIDEVVRLPHVDDTSLVQADNFALLSKKQSTAFNAAKNNGPYHVVNLDLCDGFGSKTPGSLNSDYYNAVSNLLSIQSKMPTPWIFFLTTRVDRPCVNEDILRVLIEKYIKNLDECDCFKASSVENFGVGNREQLDEAIGGADGLLAIFLTGIVKWLIGMSLEYKPPMKAKLLDVAGYRVNHDADHEDLVSLAILFEPTFHQPADPMGLARQQQAVQNECALATRALGKMFARQDVDKVLDENPVLLEEMTRKTEELLRSARYNIEDYRAWLQRAGPG